MKTKINNKRTKGLPRSPTSSQKVVEPSPSRPTILSDFCWLRPFQLQTDNRISLGAILTAGVFHELMMGANRVPQTER
jgi:hypothetical protein